MNNFTQVQHSANANKNVGSINFFFEMNGPWTVYFIFLMLYIGRYIIYTGIFDICIWKKNDKDFSRVLKLIEFLNFLLAYEVRVLAYAMYVPISLSCSVMQNSTLVWLCRSFQQFGTIPILKFYRKFAKLDQF